MTKTQKKKYKKTVILNRTEKTEQPTVLKESRPFWGDPSPSTNIYKYVVVVLTTISSNIYSTGLNSDNNTANKTSQPTVLDALRAGAVAVVAARHLGPPLGLGPVAGGAGVHHLPKHLFPQYN